MQFRCDEGCLTSSGAHKANMPHQVRPWYRQSDEEVGWIPDEGIIFLAEDQAGEPYIRYAIIHTQCEVDR